jgi:putative redox protein
MAGTAHGLTAISRSIPGTLRQEIIIDGKHRLITDEPAAVGGDGSAPAPHELLPAALAGCVSTTLVMYAKRNHWDIGQVTVEVDYDHRSTPRHADIAIELTGTVTADQLERLERIAAACPVRRSIETGVDFDEHILVSGRAAA